MKDVQPMPSDRGLIIHICMFIMISAAWNKFIPVPLLEVASLGSHGSGSAAS